MILGDLIKKYREENGMSMEQFAQRSGLSKAYVSILERNRNPVNGKPVVPSLETIKSVAQAIGKDFNDVIALLDGNQQVQLASPSPAGRDDLTGEVQPEIEMKDQLMAFYGEVKDDLTEDDIDDIMASMRVKAERNKRKGTGV